MSGIVAIVAPDGETIEPRLVERMLEAQGYRGPDGRRVWIGGSVAFGYCQLGVTPEAAHEQQPVSNELGTIRLVFDGRLDNRNELRDALRSAGRALRGTGDADLLLCAYETWGTDCVERLLGDFAFAIWDQPRRALICARDILGSRPLYVHQRGGLTVVASEVAPLMGHPSVRREPNEGFVAECLSGQIVHRSDTVWRDVSRLEPGHLLVAEDGRTSSRRYWQPDPRLEIRYQRDDEYGEHLAELLRAAIRPRLRTSGPLGVMLSGGLDSSSIVGALHQMDAVNGFGPLRAYSIVDPGEEWDETPFIEAVAAKWPVQPRYVPPFLATPAHLSAEAVRVQDLPPYPNGEMANTLLAAATDEGVRVLLTGLWSDEWFTGSFHYYADLLGGLRFKTLWQHLAAQPNRPDTFRPRSMFRSMVWPLVPPPVRRAVKWTLGRDAVAPWITPALAKSVALADRLRPDAEQNPFPTHAKADSYAMAFSGGSIHASEAHERSVAHFGLDTRHPFGDRRVLEFGLALPEDQRWRGALTKYVLRSAAREWLPAEIRQRTTYGTASGVLCGIVRELVAGGLWQNSVMARRGWVDSAVLTRAFDQITALYVAGNERYDELANRLWLVCAVELWAARVLEG